MSKLYFKSMTAEEARKALANFWEEARKKYGENLHFGLDDEDRQRLLELEKQYSVAKKFDAAKN